MQGRVITAAAPIVLSLLAVIPSSGCAARGQFEGGTRLEFEYDSGEANTASKELRSVIEKRLELAKLAQFRVEAADAGTLTVDVPDAVSNLEEIQRLVTQPGRFSFHLVLDGDDERVDESPEGKIEDATIQDARAFVNEYGQATILVDFDDETGTRLGELTEKNIERRLAIVLDGRILAQPVIRDRIEERAMLSAVFSEEEMHETAAVLGGGRLPVALRFVQRSSR